ncbi:MAG: hypothetical protein U1F98_06850 [Verrucomicrobiota bacterium]
MSETVQSWLDRAAKVPGVQACGVRRADRSFGARSASGKISETQATQVVRDVAEAFYAMQQQRIPAEQLKWSFQGGVVLAVNRQAGAIGVVVVGEETADSAEVAKLLSEFPAG